MDVGRSAPRYQALGLLYPRSKLLQSQISEYFIVVVHLCNRIMKFARKSAFSKLGSTVNDSDVKELQAELNIWAKSIKEEVDLLLAQKIDMEVQSSSAFRALSTRHAKATEHQRKLAERLRILDMFSTHDYETLWRQIRKTGTTTSFLQTTEYHDWRDCKASTTLLYRGRIGSGKTVMMANIVNDLVAHTEGTDAVVAYYFCPHDSWKALDCHVVLGTLVRQILEAVPDLTTLDPRHKHSFRGDQFTTVLQEIVPQSTHIWIVLDGLHNSDEEHRNRILLSIKELQSARAVHLCASHREDSHSLIDMPIFRPAVVTLQPDNAQDIEAFVDTELERCLTVRTLVLGDPALIFDIRNALMKGSRGMFLWATLQIQSLCSMKTDKEIREALLNLPRNLTQVYNRILNQLRQPGKTYQTAIFKLIFAAIRPLTIQEMQEALSVTLGDTFWDPSKLLNSVDPALATCGCLITVDEEDSTIRTVHPSVNQYLVQKDREGDDGGVCFDLKEARTFVSSTMVTYLGYGLFGTELSSALPAMQLGSAPSHIISSTLDTSKSVQSVALKFLRSMKESQFDATKVFAENLTLQSKPNAHRFPFQYFAKPAVVTNLHQLPMLLCNTSENFFQLFKQGTIRLESPEEMVGITWVALQPPGNTDITDLLNNLSLEGELSGKLAIDVYRLLPSLLLRAMNLCQEESIKYLLDMYRPLFQDYFAAVEGIQGNVPKVLRDLCKYHFFPGCTTQPTPQDLRHVLIGSNPNPLMRVIRARDKPMSLALIEHEFIMPDDEMLEEDGAIESAAKLETVGILDAILCSKGFAHVSAEDLRKLIQRLHTDKRSGETMFRVFNRQQQRPGPRNEMFTSVFMST